MSSCAKPVMRRHWQRYALKSVAFAIAFGSFNSLAYYFLVHVPRVKAEEEFLRTYDADAHYKELVKYRMIVEPENDIC